MKKTERLFLRLPLLDTLRAYRREWIAGDISAGLAIAAVGLPSAIAYPAIAGLPPETGLYASILAVIGYALFGPSPRLIMGPDAATMIMLAAVLASLPAGTGERVAVASALAIIVAGCCILARLLRLDVVSNFLSRPILTGFMTGISLSILIGQIGRFTGLKIESDGFLRPVAELSSKLGLIHWPTFALAASMLCLLLIMKRLRSPVPGPVVVVALSILLSWAFDLQAGGIKVVGSIPANLPSFTLPWPLPISFVQLITDGLAVWLVSFSAGIVSARAFGAQAHYPVDARQELSGFAAANIASGLFGGFPVTSSDSRTAINLSVGGRTRLAGLASAAALIVILLYLNPMLALLPIPALGAILAAAAIGLMDFSGLATLWRVSRVEFIFALVGLVGPVVLGVLDGVVVAVGSTLAYLLYRGMRPRVARLGRIPGQPGFYKLHRVERAAPVEGLAVFVIEGSFIFYSSDYVRDEIEQQIDGLPQKPRWVIIDASSSPVIDSTAAAALIGLSADLKKQGIRLGIAEVHRESLDLLMRAGFIEEIGENMLFTGLEDMLVAFNAAQNGEATMIVKTPDGGRG